MAGATAMMDVSDGLGTDLGRLAAASGVHVDVDGTARRALGEALLPAAEALVGEPGSWDLASRWVLSGGEDHALVACFPPDAVLPPPFVRIGDVLPVRGGRPAVTVDGTEDERLGGWDHFA